MDKDLFFQNDTAIYQTAVTDFNNIIKHIGPSIHSFTLDFDDEYTEDGTTIEPFSSKVVDYILSACPMLTLCHLKEQYSLIVAKLDHYNQIFAN